MIPVMSWLPECSADALRRALENVAPEVAALPLPVAAPPDGEEQWRKLNTVVGGRYFVKFAWSRTAALGVARESAVLAALSRAPGGLPLLPELVAAGTDPVVQVTRLVPGTSLFAIADTVDRDAAGRQLAEFLAALHTPAARARAEAAVGAVTGAGLTGPVQPPARPEMLRTRVLPFLPAASHAAVARWCDWTAAVQSSPGPDVLVHGDFHGNNQVWDGGRLRAVVDFETTAVAEAEYDLRSLPGPVMGPGVELLTAVLHHYARLTGRRLSPERVMAWNVRQSLGDVLWRAEAGLPMSDGRTPRDWVDDLAVRFRLLGIDPDRDPAPPAGA